MKNDDSCCQQGANKKFKGSKCQCAEETEEEKVSEKATHGGACCHGH